VHSYEEDLVVLRHAAERAAELAMTFFRNNPNAWAKTGGSVVTEADMQIDSYLRRTLLAERPGYGWLSEETADDLSRRSRERVFVVDPIDGTRAFIEGADYWCVSLAVVEKGRPVAAALAAPARAELFTAVKGGGAWLHGRKLLVSQQDGLAGAKLAGPRGWLKTSAIARTRAAPQPHISALAYRLASVASARLDAAFASPRANDWDLAASDLLVHEAGGLLTELDGSAPRYNQETSRHGALAAAGKALQSMLVASVAEAEREVARGRRV
jgi:myo-inositol-1(or 4)-monophosphatase